MNPNQLANIATAVLGAIADYYVAQDQPIPDRQVTPPGAPSWDCEQLAVWPERTVPHQGDPAAGLGATSLFEHPGSMLRTATLVVTIMRCIPETALLSIEGSLEPQVVLPDPAAVSEVGVLISRDEVLVLEALRAASSDTGPLTTLNGWSLSSWQPVGPAGGFVASEHRFLVGTDWDPGLPEGS